MMSVLRYLLRKFYFICAILLITLAVVVQTGRTLSPWVSEYRESLAAYLGKTLNANVQIDGLDVQWDGLKPVLSVAGLEMTNHASEPIFSVSEALFRLDLLRSLFKWQLVWGTVTVDQARLEFHQDRQGFWRIPGLPPRDQVAPESARAGSLLDMLLLANRMEFRSTHLAFEFFSGQRIALDSPSLLLENEGNFHRIELSVDIEGRESAVHLVLESQGDPRDQSRFALQGYLALDDFPTSEPLLAAGGLLLGDVTQNRVSSEGGLNARLWFNSRPASEGYDIHGRVDFKTLSVPLLDKHYRLDRFSTAINGYWLRTGAWQMALPGINAQLGKTAIEDLNLAVSVAEPKAPMLIRVDQFLLADWLEGVNESGLLTGSPLLDVLNTLNPRGELSRIQVQLPLDDPKAWRVEAQAHQVAVNAWNGVPALTGVDGYVQAHQGGGYINLDSRRAFSMHYSPTYAEPMNYQHAHGQIAWWLKPDDHRIYVNSSAIRLRNAEEEATGFLWLSIPWRDPRGDLDLYLQIGARHLNASLYRKYTPAIVPGPLLEWLNDSIGSENTGVAKEAGFLFRGTLNSPEHDARSYQLYLDLENAALAYHEDWPALTQLDGRLMLDNERVDVSVFKGKVYDSDIAHARISTFPNPEDEGALLRIDGELSGVASDGLRVLREGYLRTLIGSAMDTWYFQGTHRTALELAIPLHAGAKGGKQQVDVDVELALAGLENLNLYPTDLKSRIHYDSESGLTAEQLTAQLFDYHVEGRIESRMDPTDTATVISLQGKVDTETLSDWTLRPEILFFEGAVPYQAEIQIHHQQAPVKSPSTVKPKLQDQAVVSVAVTSNLDGVSLDLPAPFGKTAEQERALAVNLSFRTKSIDTLIDYRSGEEQLLQTRFLFASGEADRLLNADIAVGRDAKLQARPQFRLSGYLAGLQVADWLQVQDRYEVYQRQVAERNPAPDGTTTPVATESLPGTIAGLPVHVDVVLGQQALGPLMLEDVALNAWRHQDAWHLSFASPILTGRLQLPDARSTPMAIDIDELHLTRELLGDKAAVSSTDDNEKAQVASPIAASLTDAAAQFDPRSLPRADVNLNALFLDGHNYGNWSLQVRPDKDGVMFNRIRGNIRGITVSGVKATAAEVDSPLSGAQIYWSQTAAGAKTRFVGVLSTDNVADVLQAWEKPDLIESKQASFQADLTWPGAPGEFSLVNLHGNLDLALGEGRFNRSAGAGEGVLRLLSLVNFDTLARRLRLDFSDLYKSGLAFDRINGRLAFEKGQIHLVEPLQVESPSSRLQLAGSINLKDETINARLVAALPVAGNLTFLAAVATGLPAAAGIYLISKLFRKQVDQATSVSYSIRGSWDNPSMKFDRLFESEESLRESARARREEEKTKGKVPAAKK